MDQNAIEELFERNADMRLLELRHSEPGIASASLKRTGGAFGAESIVAGGSEAVFADIPRLRVAIAAAPAGGVIPGAVVGIAIDVVNDGTGPAPESRLLLALPHESEYRDGTLRVDGREPMAPEQLFANGLPIARLPGESSTKITLQIGVRPGLAALFLQPRLHAEGVPIVGTAGVSIKRGSLASTQIGHVPFRPFYELDEDEDDGAPARGAEPVLPPVMHPPVETPAVEPPVPAPPPLPAPDVRATAVTPPAEERMTRYRAIGAPEASLLQRLFAAPVPGVVAHCVAISTIACVDPAAGPDTSGLAAFVRGDLESLGRALVLMRLGKPVTAHVDQIALDRLALDWMPSDPAGRPGGPVTLRRDLRATECAAIAGLFQRSARDATLRLRIALLALAGASLEGAGDAAAAEACVTALAAYRSAVLTWLVPLCVASAAVAAYVIPDPPPAVDVAGRRLAAALNAALAA